MPGSKKHLLSLAHKVLLLESQLALGNPTLQAFAIDWPEYLLAFAKAAD